MAMTTQQGRKGNMASVVSRRLKREGYTISSYARRHKADGIFVNGARNGNTTIVVDLGAGSDDVARELESVILAWPQASYVTVTHNPGGSSFVNFDYEGMAGRPVA